MEKYITISKQASTAALLAAMVTAAGLLAERGAANVAKAMRTARTWLNSTHDFFPEDGDPVTCTGWQFIGYGAAACVVAFVLSIQW